MDSWGEAEADPFPSEDICDGVSSVCLPLLTLILFSSAFSFLLIPGAQPVSTLFSVLK